MKTLWTVLKNFFNPSDGCDYDCHQGRSCNNRCVRDMIISQLEVLDGTQYPIKKAQLEKRLDSLNATRKK